MDGWPVWLASGSLWLNQRNVLTGEMSGAQRSLVLGVLEEALCGLGDADRERGFRMNLTICIHRAISEEELESLPVEWCEHPAEHLAGGPIEIMYRRGVVDGLSVRPCKSPKRQPLGRTWLPIDCGQCPQCQARNAVAPV